MAKNFFYRFVNIDLPVQVKRNGVQIRFWQPKHPGSFNADWALDSIVISGIGHIVDEVNDDFEVTVKNFEWFSRDYAVYSSYCGSDSAIIGIMTAQENVILTTSDVNISNEFILQFSISFGCNISVYESIMPVYLQYSTNKGISWHNITEECLPHYNLCNGRVSQQSVYYGSKGWIRHTISLAESLVSR